jgi:lysophospholipase L1-like esterase
MRPGRRYAYQGIPVEINSHGLRCPEFTPEKRDGVYRILNLGDSIAFGWGVEMEATYGQLLAKRAALPGDDQTTQMEVINAGAPGWNLENELAFLQDRGLEFQPDLLLLDVTLANDIIGKSALVTNQRPALIDWLRGHTKFWPLLTVQLRWLQARLQGRERIDVIDPPHQPEAYFPLSPTDERWVSLWKTIEEINRTAARHDIKMILVLFPLEDQVLDGTFPTTPQEVFRQRAAQAGIPVVDLLPAYQAACRAKPGGACTLEDRYLFADVWMHPSALGHQIAASELTKVIMQDIQFER